VSGRLNPEQEREQKLASLAACRRIAEEAYDRLYEVHTSSDTTACYSDAKEALYDAIHLARELELADEIKAIETRLAHIKAVFRSQFS
jgi:hypothetical protein